MNNVSALRLSTQAQEQLGLGFRVGLLDGFHSQGFWGFGLGKTRVCCLSPTPFFREVWGLEFWAIAMMEKQRDTYMENDMETTM